MQMLSFSNNFSYQLHDILLLPSLGGSVKGGEVLGKYPEDITDDGPMTLGRGKPFCSLILFPSFMLNQNLTL